MYQNYLHVKFFLSLSVILILLFAWLPLAYSRESIKPNTAKKINNYNLQNAVSQSSSNANQTPCDRSHGNGTGLLKRCVEGGSSGVARGDFNGDGFGDLAVGIPFEDLGNITDAGAVTVIYGSATGLTTSNSHVPAPQFWTQDSNGVPDKAEKSDLFGSSLASGDFNGDGFSDLAVGVPGESVSTPDNQTGVLNAGAVNVIYGSPAGLTASLGSLASQFWSQDSDVILDASEPGDSFGSSLAWGDFNRDGIGDLAISVPNEDVGSISDAGGVNVIYGTANGLKSENNQFWTQNNLNLSDRSETSDKFGTSLSAGDFNGDGASDLAIGVPLEGVIISSSTEHQDAGAVNIIYGSVLNGLTVTDLSVPRSQFWTQNSPDIPGFTEPIDQFGISLAAGDFDGNGKEDLAIGVLNDSFTLSDSTRVGSVNIIYGETSGLSATRTVLNSSPVVTAQIWNKSSSGMPTLPVSYFPEFGKTLADGDFNGDGKKDLAIGIPSQSLQPIFTNPTAEGAIVIIYGSSKGLITDSILAPVPQAFFENSIPGANGSKTGDKFGSSLTVWNFGNGSQADLVIGVPFKDFGPVTDAGQINVIYGSAGGLSVTNNQVWIQGKNGLPDAPESGDAFGQALY